MNCRPRANPGRRPPGATARSGKIPSYPDQAAQARRRWKRGCSRFPPLGLRRRGPPPEGCAWRSAAEGKAFVLQGGDCAESFGDFTANVIRDTFRVLLQMAVVLTFGGQRAGGEARPHGRDSSPSRAPPTPRPCRRRHFAQLTAAISSMVRIFRLKPTGFPDPARMEFGYFQSAGTLNLLRAFASGGYADLHEVHRWNLDPSSNARRWPDRYQGSFERALRKRLPSWRLAA